jgi:acyl dehydratase
VNLLGQPAYVGRHCGTGTHDVTPEVVAFYADALDDHHPLHERHAPPLLHHSECYRFLGEWYLKNLFGNLHGRQDWELFAPIPVGARIHTRSTLIDRYERRGRDWVVNETDVMDAEGRLLVRGRTHQSFLPKKESRRETDVGAPAAREHDAASAPPAGFVVDPSRPRTRPAPPPFPTATGPDLPSVTKTVDARRCWMFSGPGRNYHTDREQAEKLGFPNIVVQGMMSTCFVSQVMQDHFGMGWLCGGRMSVKLTDVLWVDETVTARARIRDESREGTRTRVHCEVWIDKDDGTRILVGDASAVREGA